MFPKRKADGGMQAERTSLSWYRTIFVLLLDCLLIIRVGYSDQNDIVYYAGILLAIVTISFYFVAAYRSPQLLLDTELTNDSSIWMKRYLAMLLCISALMVSLSSLMNLYSLLK